MSIDKTDTQNARSRTQEALQLLNSQPARSAALFLEEYRQSRKDDTLTNFALSLWIGVKMSCHSATKIEICARSNMRDVNYAEELFVAAVFRSLNETSGGSGNPNLLHPGIKRLAEIVTFSLSVLKTLVEEKRCEYATGWYVELLRAVAKYSECRNVAAALLQSGILGPDSRKIIEGCLAGIGRPENDSKMVCQKASSRFPDSSLLDLQLLEKLQAVVILAKKELRPETEPTKVGSSKRQWWKFWN
jgi:hypothetical protein